MIDKQELAKPESLPFRVHLVQKKRKKRKVRNDLPVSALLRGELSVESNVLYLTNGIIGYSNGFDINGATNTTEAFSGAVTPTYTNDRLNYVKKEEGGNWSATIIKPQIGLETSIPLTDTELTASDAQDSDRFGGSCALSSDGLVMSVGAYLEDTAGGDAGKIYTYKRATVDDNWTEVTTLTASDAQNNDYFSSSCDISGDGLVMSVGAYPEDTAGADAGKVYTYKRATIDSAWTEVTTLTASDAENYDRFGASCALSSDGLIMSVGAYTEDTAGFQTGKVYTYKRATIDDNWTEVTTLTASDAQDDDNFGYSCALSSDGLVMSVGSYLEDTAGTSAGKVYTYKRSTIDDNWTEVTTLTASDAVNWDAFGRSCTLSSDGLVMSVGAFWEDTAGTDAGKVYTYKRSTINDNWTEVTTLTASDAQASDRFGGSCALSSDGLVMSVGAYEEDTAGDNAGKVYTYSRATIDDDWGLSYDRYYNGKWYHATNGEYATPITYMPQAAEIDDSGNVTGLVNV